MELKIRRASGLFHMIGQNELNKTLETDAKEDIGGTNKGVRPMEAMLLSMGSCSAIDVVLILQKQKQTIDDIEITLRGEREKETTPSLFTDVVIHFDLYGDIDDKKADRAISLSIEKYCSVAETLRRAGANISYSFSISPK